MTEHLDCPFCDIPERPASPFDVSYPTGDGITTIMPALGMLLPGYVLAVTNEHMTSFAQLERSELAIVNKSLDRTQAHLAKFFGEYVRVEHGSDNIVDCGSGGCIDHAHQHLIPDNAVGNAVLELLPWQQLASYKEIADFSGSPYIYLARQGMHYVVPEPALPGQWIRRQIAAVNNFEEWDWSLGQGALNLLTTFDRLQLIPDRNMIVDLRHDRVTFQE